MDEIKKILSENIFDWYPSNYPSKSFIDTAMNHVNINDLISVAGLLAPEFIEHEDHVFFKENVKTLLEKKKIFPCPYGYKDKKEIERYYNLFHLGEFFLATQNEASNDTRMLYKFGKLLIYFWRKRLKELFPNKSFSFEIEYDLYDEHGLCLTFWQE